MGQAAQVVLQLPDFPGVGSKILVSTIEIDYVSKRFFDKAKGQFGGVHSSYGDCV